MRMYLLKTRLGPLGVFAVPLGGLVFLILSADLQHVRHTHDLHLQHHASAGHDASHLLPAKPSASSVSKKGGWPPTKEEYARKVRQLQAVRSSGSGSRKTKNVTEQADGKELQHPVPLDALIDSEGSIVAPDASQGGLQWLLDFAILGFGKCGTSTIMNWLDQHPALQCLQEEVWALSKGRPKGLIARLYRDLPVGSQYKRGYKCPADISDLRVLNYYRKYWPKTKLLVGVRHPVSWFQSLYNFRVQNLENGLPEPNKLKGQCMRGMKNTCTEKGNFAYDLMRLGKTNAVDGVGPRLHTPLEDEILGHFKRAWYNATELAPVPNDVFFFEITQLSDAEHQDAFRHDVQQFLGLDTELPPLVHEIPGKKHNATEQAVRDAQKMNICDPEHAPVRDELMRLSRLNSRWMRETFLKLPGVYHSDSLESILEGWMRDPCENVTVSVAAAAIGTGTNETNGAVAGTTAGDDTATNHGKTAAAAAVEGGPPVLSSGAKVEVVAAAVVKEERQLLDEQLLHSRRPPLEAIVLKNNTIVGDPQFLLDFSIVGFGKCGTSTLMEWLHGHPRLQCIQEEVWSLVFGQPHGLVRRLYRDLPPDEGPTRQEKYMRGYKCPSDVADSRVLNYYRRYFPKTKLFIGVRHPVSWFQSLYNFRAQNLDYLPPPNKLIGRCGGGMKNTCTEKGNFAFDLMRMGKKNHDGPVPMSELEQQILGRFKRAWYNSTEIPAMKNDVFFFDIAQLGDSNETRTGAFRTDVKTFLGLTEDFPPKMAHAIPGKEHNATVQAEKDKLKINICDEEYLPVRTELMRLSRLNSQWMRDVFLNLPGVYSSRQHLEELLLGWMDDPCEKDGVTSIR